MGVVRSDTQPDASSLPLSALRRYSWESTHSLNHKLAIRKYHSKGHRRYNACCYTASYVVTMYLASQPQTPVPTEQMSVDQIVAPEALKEVFKATKLVKALNRVRSVIRHYSSVQESLHLQFMS